MKSAQTCEIHCTFFVKECVYFHIFFLCISGSAKITLSVNTSPMPYTESFLCRQNKNENSSLPALALVNELWTFHCAEVSQQFQLFAM